MSSTLSFRGIPLPSKCPSSYATYLCICLSLPPPLCLCLSLCLFVRLVCLSVFLSFCVGLSFCPSVCLSIYLSLCLSVSLSFSLYPSLSPSPSRSLTFSHIQPLAKLRDMPLLNRPRERSRDTRRKGGAEEWRHREHKGGAAPVTSAAPTCMAIVQKSCPYCFCSSSRFELLSAPLLSSADRPFARPSIAAHMFPSLASPDEWLHPFIE